MKKLIMKKDLINISPNSNLLKSYKKQFPNISQYQKEVLVGIILGDGYIYTRNNGKTYGIKFE
jgi:hypothetical protein